MRTRAGVCRRGGQPFAAPTGLAVMRRASGDGGCVVQASNCGFFLAAAILDTVVPLKLNCVALTTPGLASLLLHELFSSCLSPAHQICPPRPQARCLCRRRGAHITTTPPLRRQRVRPPAVALPSRAHRRGGDWPNGALSGLLSNCSKPTLFPGPIPAAFDLAFLRSASAPAPEHFCNAPAPSAAWASDLTERRAASPSPPAARAPRSCMLELLPVNHPGIHLHRRGLSLRPRVVTG